MKISYSNLNRLTRWEAFKFLDDVLTFIDSRQDEMPELYTNKVAELRTAFENYDDKLVQERKTASKHLIESEEMRDYAIRKIYSICREYSDYRFDETKEVAANGLLDIFKNYGTGNDIAKMAQDTESAVLLNLMQDFQDPTSGAYLTALDLFDAIDSLRAANFTFDREQQERSESNAEFVAGVVKTARNDVQDQFIAFADVVNALAIVEGDEKYASLKQYVNDRLDTYVTRSDRRRNNGEEEDSQEVEQ